MVVFSVWDLEKVGGERGKFGKLGVAVGSSHSQAPMTTESRVRYQLPITSVSWQDLTLCTVHSQHFIPH